MKTSNATRKIRIIKSRLASRYFFSVIFFLLITLALLFFYLSSQYLDVSFAHWIKENLDFLFYYKDQQVQLFINIGASFIILLINIIYMFIIYYVFSIKYQKQFLEVFFDELKLNEIYLLEKRSTFVNSLVEFSTETLGLKKMNNEHLFSIRSLFNINFTQMFSKDAYIKKGLLVSSETDKNFDAFVEFKFNEDFNLEDIDNKGLYTFIVNEPSKYPHTLYINTNLGIMTSKVINNSVLDMLFSLRRFTRSDFSLCIFKNKFYLYINGWELRISDSFRKKLTYNSIDKKIDSFTKLVDDLQDLYICILRNYEVIKYGK